MIHLKTFGFLIILMVENMTPTQNFVANVDFHKLLETEEKVIKSLQKYVRTEKRRLDFLEKYLNRSKLEYETAIKDVPYYLGNPINAYTIIKRLGPELEFVENILKNKTMLKLPKAVFPTEKDMNNAISGLMIILVSYSLNITHLANGILNDTASQDNESYTDIVTPMTADDCFTIGKHLFSHKVYEDSTLWLKEAYKKLDERNDTEFIVEVIDYISRAYHYLENWDDFKFWAKKRIELKPNDSVAKQFDIYLKKLSGRRTGGQLRKRKLSPDTNGQQNKDKHQWDLCTRRVNHRLFESGSLSCHYAYGPHPFLKLAPLKAEYLHRNPDVMMFYQVLSDDEMEAVQELSKPIMWNVTLNDLPPPHDKATTTNYKFVHLADNSSKVVAHMSRKALMISGLGPDDDEPMRILNYGIGGLSLAHWDTKPKSAIGHEKDRIGSILFYLTEVEQGGATVFPILGLTVFPVKGAATFWSTKLPSGHDDLWTLHASCPALRGDKWIAIKWPHHYAGKQCPLWTTEKGLVTEELLKEFIKDHHSKYVNIAKQINLMPAENFQKGDSKPRRNKS